MIKVFRQNSDSISENRESGTTSVNDSNRNLSVVRSSPNQGNIRINLGTTSESQIGDKFRIDAKLSAPTGGL